MELILEKKYVQARRLMEEMNEVDLAEFLEEIDDNASMVLIFRLLPKELAADVFAYLEHDFQQKIVEGITDRELAGIMDELFLDDTVDFIEEMPASIVKRVLKNTDKETRQQINQLLMYPEDSAGSLMTTEFMQVDDEWTVARAIREIRRQSEDKESISVLYVTDRTRRLEGVISLREVLVANDEDIIRDLMTTDVICATTYQDQAEVAEDFKKYDMISLPVVDNEKRLVGIITIDDIVDVIEEETTEDIHRMAAMQAPDDTYLLTSPFSIVKKRFMWLIILMILSILTGLIIAYYEDALSANVLLATFIPMLMSTGGNSGNQASVSLIRSITLGEVEFSDIGRVIWKEFRVSLMVGVAMAIVCFGMVSLIYRQVLVSAAVAITLFVVVVAAKLVGSALPMVATKLRLDPALMASPLITTIIDIIALFIYFNVATRILGV
ncbi:MAG: magnesium transporter [Oscillospiraceae bacterium]|nr:magnesium transporter [Oscillospiraceae bacterium]